MAWLAGMKIQVYFLEPMFKNIWDCWHALLIPRQGGGDRADSHPSLANQITLFWEFQAGETSCLR